MVDLIYITLKILLYIGVICLIQDFHKRVPEYCNASEYSFFSHFQKRIGIYHQEGNGQQYQYLRIIEVKHRIVNATTMIRAVVLHICKELQKMYFLWIYFSTAF